jgi:hypothetical protein
LEDQLSSNALLGTKAVTLEAGAILELEADEAIILGAKLASRGGRLRNQSHCGGCDIKLKQKRERKLLRWVISTKTQRNAGHETNVEGSPQEDREIASDGPAS